jgi:hypothetical protein
MLRDRLRGVREEWPRLLLEVVVLVIGISISFALEEWREERQAGRDERRVWRAVHEDLAADSLFLSRRIGQIRTMLASYERLLRNQPDSLDVDMDRLVSYVAFRPADGTYEEVRQGSGSRLRNRELVGRLASLHTRDYDLVREWDAITRDFVLERMFPYLDLEGPHVPTTAEGSTIVGLSSVYRALASRDAFRNLVRTHHGFKQAQLVVYERALVATRDLMKRLEPAFAER